MTRPAATREVRRQLRCRQRCGRVLLVLVTVVAECGDAKSYAGPLPAPRRAAPAPAQAAAPGRDAVARGNNDAAQGQLVFAGKGNCTVCHTIGKAPSSKSRAPDLAGIGKRAAARARQFGMTGAEAATRYLVDAIVRPAAHVVEGYNPAPESWLPSGLSDDELRQLVMYLESLGGQVDARAVSLPAEWLAAKRQDYQRELDLFSLGNPEQGKTLFHDAKGKAGCVKCHKIDGVGKETCPNLTNVFRVQRPSYVLQSLLDSSAFIVRGYRQAIILDLDGRVHTGLPVKEDDESITLVVDQEGKTEVVLKDDIDERRISEVSIMPAGFSKELSGQQLMDVVAYVLHHEAVAGQLAGHAKPRPGGTPSNTIASAPSLDVFPTLTEDQQRYRTAMQRGDPIGGSRIYAHYCTMCHGPKGDGTGFNAVNLATKPANHADNRRMSKTEDLLLHGVITRGGMKTGRSFLMPPWGGTLSDRDRWDLIAYIRTLHADLRASGQPRPRR